MSQPSLPEVNALLHIPYLRVQNANAVTGPHSWGHPGPTAFTGLMTALRRKLAADIEIDIVGIGIVNHRYQTQTNGQFEQYFNLTRNPVMRDGKTASIVEEGRIHLELSLVFGLQLGDALLGADDCHLDDLASEMFQLLQSMRIAGGSVIPELCSKHTKSEARKIAGFVHLTRY